MTVAEENRSESRPFEADVAKLLQLMVHSVYSEKSVFLRELISNAADACERLRYEAIANPVSRSNGPRRHQVMQKRRGRSTPIREENSRQRRFEVATAPLTLGKLNAVRAAFKAGVTPSRIAKQFGISQSEVRKALAGDASAKSSKP